jgi:hypothetical protein
MLSAYTWNQFGLFILALLLCYYLVVALVYYRQELTALLASRRLGGDASPTGPGAAAPPALVRPTSAFHPTAAGSNESIPDDAPPTAEPTDAGAAANLPPAPNLVVGGELPLSTAIATDSPESSGEAAPGVVPPAPAANEGQLQEADPMEERLASLVRREAHAQPAEAGPEPAAPPQAAPPQKVLYEPLASFEEPIASVLDLVTAEPAPPLVAASTVTEYIARLQAGQSPPLPPALQGSCLAEQMAQHLEEYSAELSALFAGDEL